MNYLYIGLSLVLVSIIAIFRPNRSKKIIYNIVYLLPFWCWGLLMLILSAFVWYTKTFSLHFWFLFTSLFLTGATTLFLPKRRLKKRMESFLKLNKQETQLVFIVFLIFGLIITLA